MYFRFTLEHDVEGSLVINEPDGWADAKLKLERHDQGHTLVEYFDGGANGSFVFYGESNQFDGGINMILDIETAYGLDADLNLLIDIIFDTQSPERVFSGQVDISAKTWMKDNKLQAPVIRDDFWAKFINRFDTPVNLSETVDLDGNAVSAVTPVTIDMTGQKLQKQYQGEFNEIFVMNEPDWNVGDYIQLSMDEDILDEIEERFTIPTAVNPELPVWIFAMEEPGDYTFDLRIECSVYYEHANGVGLIGDPGCQIDSFIKVTSSILDFYIQKNDESPILFTETDTPIIVTKQSTTYEHTSTMSLKIGDVIRIYGVMTSDLGALHGNFSNFLIWGKTNETTAEFRVAGAGTLGAPCVDANFSATNQDISFDEDPPSGAAVPTYFSILANTTYPDTQAQGYLLHDAFFGVLQRLGLGDDPFYSEYLGSTVTNSRTYAEDGCGWGFAILKGLQIRQYTLSEKPFFISFKDLWEGADPIFNLNFGYDTIGDDQVIRIEQKADSYDGSATSVDFDNVREISASYDQDRIFKAIKTGYRKWQSEDISGIDDPQTKHTYATRLKKAGRDLTIESGFIAASLAFETTRRKTKQKSEDYKFDNDTFILALNRNDVSPDRYIPELDENFNSITNLLNSDTRYNSILTPLRNLLRWANFLNGGLFQYQTSVYKFVSGEGNYDMESDYSCASGLQCLAIICDNLAEDGPLDLNEYWSLLEYIHLPLLYTIDIDMTWEQYLEIRNNRNMAIGISQTSSNHVKFFIKTLEFEVTKGKAKIVAWPLTLMAIDVIETQQRMIECEPVEVCERVTEDDDERITEDGFTRILEEC